MSLNILIKLIIFGSILSITGCASVKFYSDAELKDETGLTYFEPKPYLLVTRKSKDQVDTSIVYLPDKSKPQFAVFKPGFGTHEFSLSLTNGILTAYGQKADSKIPETINAVAGLLKEGTATATSAGVFLPQAATDYRLIANELNEIGKTLFSAIQEIDGLTNDQKNLVKISNINESLSKTAADFNLPKPSVDNNLSILKGINDQLNLLKMQLPESFDEKSPPALYNSALTTAINRIDFVILTVKGKSAPTPDFELYEILQDKKGTTLKQVL